jgi:hypothetical protein
MLPLPLWAFLASSRMKFNFTLPSCVRWILLGSSRETEKIYMNLILSCTDWKWLRTFRREFNNSHSSWTAWPWRSSHYGHSKSRWLLKSPQGRTIPEDSEASATPIWEPQISNYEYLVFVPKFLLFFKVNKNLTFGSQSDLEKYGLKFDFQQQQQHDFFSSPV